MAAAAGDLPQRQRLAQRFWGAVVRGSGNIAYRLAHNTLRDLYDRVFEALTNILAPELDDRASYLAIAEAIARGDTATAEQRARELLRKGAVELGRVLDDLDAIHGDTP